MRLIADLALVRNHSDAQIRAEVLPSAISSVCSSAESAGPPGSLATASCSRALSRLLQAQEVASTCRGHDR